MKFFPFGERLLTIGTDGRLCIWSSSTGRAIWEAAAPRPSTADFYEVQLFPDGDRFVVLGEKLTIWSARGGGILREIAFIARIPPHAVRVLLGGSRLATGASSFSGDPAVIWGADDGAALHLLEHARREAVQHLESSPCGRRVVTVTNFALVGIWDAASGALLFKFPAAVTTTGVAMSWGGRRVVVSDVHGAIVAFDLGDGHRHWTWEGRGFSVHLAVLPKPERLVTFSVLGSVVHNLSSGEQLAFIDSMGGDINRVAVSATGDVLAACGGAPHWLGAQRAHAWNASTGRLLAELEDGGPERPVDAQRMHSLSMPGPPCRVEVGPAPVLSDMLLPA